MSTKTGGCMCGAVRFTAQNVPDTSGACHCEMCRRWTGSAFIGVTVPLGKVTWEDERHLGRIQSSAWAERGFCTRCGTGLYYRVTADTPYSNKIELPLGIFDDPNGFTMTNEIYIDVKPDGFAYAGQSERELMTRAECHAAYGVPSEDNP
jgi:hypothetical protein